MLCCILLHVCFKFSSVLPVTKNSCELHNPNYRPVYLLRLFGKFLVALINSKMHSYLTSEIALSGKQYVCRISRSTFDVLILTAECFCKINKK